MNWLPLLALLLGCGPSDGPTTTSPAPAPAATASVPADLLVGQVLFASERSLVVHHTETKGLITPGIAAYQVPAPDLTDGLRPGDTVSLRTREKEGVVQLKQLTRTGSAPLPEGAGGPYRLAGTVVNTEPGRITVDHERVPDVMAAMVMSFQTTGDVSKRFMGGQAIEGTLVATPAGFALVDVEQTGEAPMGLRTDIEPLQIGEVFPRMEVPVEDGSTVIVGEGQPKRTALTFLYTTCPDPAFCPALAARLQALQHELAGDARIVALTIDPEIDQLHVLKRYARGVSAEAHTWRFGRLEPEWLQQAALLSGMVVTIENGRIAHLMRMLILDTDGTVIERYDDNNWPLDRVALQLRSGQPKAKDGLLGTRYKK